MQKGDSKEFSFKETIVKKEQNSDIDLGQSGRWADQQNLKYIIFLNHFKQKFACRLKRKKIRLFEEMAFFIKTRSPIQCRTHHQKYEQKFGEPKSIVKIFKEQMGLANIKRLGKMMIDQKIEPNQQDYTIYLNRSKKPETHSPESQKNISVGIQTDPLECLPPLSQPVRPVQVAQMVASIQYQPLTTFWVPYYL